MGLGKKIIGVTAQQAAQEEKSFEAFTISIKNPADYVIHPIGGMKRFNKRYIPVKYYDSTKAEFVTGWRLVMGEGGIFDAIEAADFESRKQYFRLALQREGVAFTADDLAKKARSNLSVAQSYVLMAFLAGDDPPVCKRLSLGYKQWNELRALQEKVSPFDASKLMFGPMFSFWITLTHAYAANKPVVEYMKHSYSLTIYNSPLKDLVPVNWDKDPDTDFEALYAQSFTDAELEAIERNEVDLEKEAAPTTDDAIREMFEKAPINLGATRDNLPYFVNVPEVHALLTAQDIGCLLPGDAVTMSPTVIAGATNIPNVQQPEQAVSVSKPSVTINSKSVETSVEPLDTATAEDAVIVDTPTESAPVSIADEVDDPYLGWGESFDNAAKVAQEFKPKSALHKKMFADWQDNDGSRAGFDKIFPGEADKILTTSAKKSVPLKTPKRRKTKKQEGVKKVKIESAPVAEEKEESITEPAPNMEQVDDETMW